MPKKAGDTPGFGMQLTFAELLRKFKQAFAGSRFGIQFNQCLLPSYRFHHVLIVYDIPPVINRELVKVPPHQADVVINLLSLFRAPGAVNQEIKMILLML